MKSIWKFLVTAGLLTLTASAQSAGTSASGSGNASVTPGQAAAGANAGQSTQVNAAGQSQSSGTQVNGSGQAQASGDQKDKHTKGAQASGNGNAAGSAMAPGVDSGAMLASGTTLQAELTKSLDAQKAKPGDEVTAKVTEDVKSNGKVVVHKGSHLVGHVTEAQARSKDHAESTLGIAFDKAVLKGGQEMAFNGMVQAIAPPARGALSGAGDESTMVGGGPAPRSGGGGRSSGGGGGLLGGVGSTATGVVPGVTSTAGAATNGAVNGTLSGAGGAVGGLTAQGNLTNASRGAIGLQGLNLNSATAAGAQGSVITSASRNVKLDSGTQMLLQAH